MQKNSQFCRKFTESLPRFFESFVAYSAKMWYDELADVAKEENSFLKMNKFDCYVTFAFGCDTYMPYFKFIPEVKFCIGLTDVLDRDREFPDPTDIKYTNSIKKMVSSMIVLSFYFE